MSNKWTGFGDLDLTKVDASAGPARLSTGTYKLKCTAAIVESIGTTQNKRVVADFTDDANTGEIRYNFNVFHSSEQAMEIGLRQLKTFLAAADHPSPDKPDDVTSLIGLKCKAIIGMGKPYMKDGQERQQTEIKRFMPLGDASSSDKGAPQKSDLDDEIPF